MSLGVNLVADLVQKAYKTLGSRFDIEIVEKHHNQKIDAPSGTALMLADAINEVANNAYEYIYDRHTRRKKRAQNEIGIFRCAEVQLLESTVLFLLVQMRL